MLSNVESQEFQLTLGLFGRVRDQLEVAEMNNRALGLMRRSVASALVMSLVLSGCSTFPTTDVEEDLTPEQVRLREQSEKFNTLVVQGAVLGALSAAAICAAAGAEGWAEYVACMAVGAVAGGAGGYWLAQKDKEFTSEEERLDAMIADVQTRNQDLESLNSNIEVVVAQNNQRVKEINAELVNGTMSKEEAGNQLQVVEKDRKIITEAIEGAQKRRDEFEYAMNEFSKENPDKNVQEFEREIAKMDRLLATASELSEDLAPTTG